MTEISFTLNINSLVMVRLTDHGKAIRQQYRDKFSKIPQIATHWQDTTEEQMPLWELMYIYGHALYMGAPGGPIFESNILTIKPCQYSPSSS